MKILHVINHLSMGGAQCLLVELAPIQQQMGHEVVVLELQASQDRTLADILIASGVMVDSLHSKLSVRNPINMFRLIKYLRKYDIIHSHLFPANYWVALAKILSWSKVPIITTEHSTNNKRRNIPLFKYIDTFIYRQYSNVIACSDKALETFKKRFPIVSSVAIPNGVDVSRFVNAASYSKHDLLGVDESTFIVTMVARFDYPKRQDTIVEAISKLPTKFHVVFVGGSKEDKGLLKIQHLAEEYRVLDRVHFLYVRSDIPNILKTSDVVVMSSEYEGLSLSSIEGMASGRPFIATNVNGLREVVEGAGELFECGNADQLVSLLINFFNDREYYDRIVRDCMNRALKYDIRTVAAKYQHEYETLTVHS